MIPFIEKFLQDKYSINPLSILLPSKQIKDKNVQIITILIKAKDKNIETPFLIVKFPRYFDNQYANTSLELEKSNLHYLRTMPFNEIFLKTIPEVKFFENIYGYLVLGETVVNGNDMSQNIFSNRFIIDIFQKNLQIALNWLIYFQKTIGAKPNTWNAYLENTIKNVACKNIEIENVLKMPKFLDLINQVGTKEVRIYSQHGDFHASNLFINNEEISGVIDWEDFTLDAPPCFDFIHFVYTYLEALFDALVEIENFGIIDQFQNNITKSINSAYTYYCQNLEIDPDYLPQYLALYLLYSYIFAIDARKRADFSAKKLMVMLLFLPTNFEEFVSCIPYKNYLQAKVKYSSQNNKELVAFCEQKIIELKKRFFYK